MTDQASVSNIERLHELASLPIDALPRDVDVTIYDENRGVFSVGYDSGLEIIHEGGAVVVSGALDLSGMAGFEGRTRVSVGFADGAEPVTFTRWDKTRKDNGEGLSVPPRQREKIAGFFIEKFAA